MNNFHAIILNFVKRFAVIFPFFAWARIAPAQGAIYFDSLGEEEKDEKTNDDKDDEDECGDDDCDGGCGCS